jgi:hypothetical protein
VEERQQRRDEFQRAQVKLYCVIKTLVEMLLLADFVCLLVLLVWWVFLLGNWVHRRLDEWLGYKPGNYWLDLGKILNKTGR